jgi:hypothetical protein
MIEASMSTGQFAKLNGVSRQAVASSLCIHGHYFGVKPVDKLKTGRLRWPIVIAKSKALAKKHGDKNTAFETLYPVIKAYDDEQMSFEVMFTEVMRRLLAIDDDNKKLSARRE